MNNANELAMAKYAHGIAIRMQQLHATFDFATNLMQKMQKVSEIARNRIVRNSRICMEIGKRDVTLCGFKVLGFIHSSGGVRFHGTYGTGRLGKMDIGGIFSIGV